MSVNETIRLLTTSECVNARNAERLFLNALYQSAQMYKSLENAKQKMSWRCQTGLRLIQQSRTIFEDLRRKHSLMEMYRAKVRGYVRRNKQETAEIIRKSMAGNPIRMDQFDNKRRYDDMLDEIAKQRIGMTISDIELPPKRRVVAA